MTDLVPSPKRLAAAVPRLPPDANRSLLPSASARPSPFCQHMARPLPPLSRSPRGTMSAAGVQSTPWPENWQSHRAVALAAPEVRPKSCSPSACTEFRRVPRVDISGQVASALATSPLLSRSSCNAVITENTRRWMLQPVESAPSPCHLSSVTVISTDLDLSGAPDELCEASLAQLFVFQCWPFLVVIDHQAARKKDAGSPFPGRA